jgi:hypothetical protein
VRFSAPVQTDPGVHPASLYNGYRVFPGGKAAGAWCLPPTPCSFFFLRRYNFGEVLAFQTNSFHLERFLMQFFQFIIFIFMSLFTSSSHLFLGLLSDLVNAGDHSYTFFYHTVICHTMYMSKPSQSLCFDIIHNIFITNQSV